MNGNIQVVFCLFSDAVSQSFASVKKRKRQEENGTYEKYQQEQKRRQRIKRVKVSLSCIKLIQSKYK